MACPTRPPDALRRAIVKLMSAVSLPQWVRLLVRCGCQAPSADNSQPWRFAWDGRRLTLRLDPERGESGLGADHPATLLAMGAVVENVAQAAAAMGIPAEALKFGLGQAGGAFAEIAWDGPVRVPVDDSRLPLAGRHTNRGPYETTPFDSALHDRIATMTESTARTMVINSLDGKRHLAKLLRDASEVRFQTEELHRWLGASLRFTPAEVARGDGLDVATLLLPPGGSSLLRFSLDWRRMAMLNRFGAFKLFAALEAAMLPKCAALVAIVGSSRDPVDALAAGRLLERVWIVLNDAGLAVHPYYGLSDQLYRLRAGRVDHALRSAVTAVARDVTALIGSSDETIFMLLRAGHPTVEIPPLSRRLPVEDVLTIRQS
jgi:hypothetical protein